MIISTQYINQRIQTIIRHASQLADRQGVRVFIVGGLVRDCLLHRMNLNLDLTVEGDGIAFAKLLAKKLNGHILIHQSFLTAAITLTDGLVVDVVTARSERYLKPGSLPVVKPSGIKDDLLRRDFTINAMAFSINKGTFGAIVDPCEGMTDLKAKRIRVMHDQSFVDDPTRLLRAVRYESRLGFKMDATTTALFKKSAAKKVWLTIKPPRYMAELMKVFQEKESVQAIVRLDQLNALSAPILQLKLIASNVKIAKKLMTARVSKEQSCDPVLVWLILLHEYTQASDITFAFGQVGISQQYTNNIIRALELPKILGALSVKVISRFHVYQRLKGLSVEALHILLAQAEPKARVRIKYFIEHDKDFKLAVTGDDLKKLGLHQGVQIKEILNQLIAQAIDEQVLTRAGQLRLAQGLVKES